MAGGNGAAGTVAARGVEGLAKTIRDDVLRERPGSAAAVTDCHGCGRSFTFRGRQGDNSGRFCSTRCREYYDAGGLAYDPHYASKGSPRWYSLPLGKHGFLIQCAGCRRTFDSTGLRCCSTECERTLRERKANAATMAEVGMDAPVKRTCEAPGCGRIIPRWTGEGRKRRLTRRDARFCSPACSQKARAAEPIKSGVSEAISSEFGETPTNPHSGDFDAGGAS